MIIFYTEFNTLFKVIQKRLSYLSASEKPLTRQLQTRINLNYRPLSRLSMDLKVMPRSGRDINLFYVL